jgi:hypothetical protein
MNTGVGNRRSSVYRSNSVVFEPDCTSLAHSGFLRNAQAGVGGGITQLAEVANTFFADFLLPERLSPHTTACETDYGCGHNRWMQRHRAG